jgi:hypothetical protein
LSSESINFTRNLDAKTLRQFRTGRMRSGRIGKMNPINKQTQTINEFIAILKILGIETVVDVRIIGASGHNP